MVEKRDDKELLIKRFLTRHRKASIAVGALSVVLIAFVLVWFQPQKLFIETSVDDPLPTTDNRAVDTSRQTEDAVSLVAEGTFRSLEHETRGVAKLVELRDGRRFLRFENLATSNGPDLRVYLSEVPVSDDWYAYGERFVDLGALKGNIGDQNYALPAEVDLSRYKSAVIWCRRFSVGFGVAGLS